MPEFMPEDKHHIAKVKDELERAIQRLLAMEKHEAHEEDETQRLLLLLIYILADVNKHFLRANRTLLRIERLLEKLVVSVTVVTVKTEAASYDHGDEAKISGDVTLDGVPQPNASVSLKVADIAGVEFPLPDATTDTDGKFTAAWTIPPEVAPGVCTVTATATGMTATATFTST